MKLVLCTVILVLIAAVQADGDLDSDVSSDFANNDYELYDYEDTNDKNDSKNIEVKQENTDEKVEAEIQKALNPDGEDTFDELTDYQIEDNRSDNADKQSAEDDDANEEPDETVEVNADDLAVLPLEPSENKVSEENNEDADLQELDIWGPLPVPDENKESLEDTQKDADDVLKNPDDQFDYNAEERIVSQVKATSEEKALSENKVLNEAAAVNEEKAVDLPLQSEIDKNVEEANKLLEKHDDDFKSVNYDDFDSGEDENEKTFEELLGGTNDETLEKDLGDFHKQLDILDKISDNDSDLGEIDKQADNNESIDEIKDYEEKNDRPYKEGNILSLRGDYENFDDDIADNDDTRKLQNDQVGAEPKTTNVDEIVDQDAASSSKSVESEKPPVADKDKGIEDFDYTGEIEKILSHTNNDKDDENVNDIINRLLRHSYGNDGLVDDKMPINKDAEVFSVNGTKSTAVDETTTIAVEPESIIEEIKPTAEETLITPAEEKSSKMVDDLNSSEYNELMSQFAAAHSNKLDINSEDFLNDVAPVHISLDEPTVITSPGYPGFYPTNNIVDWIIEGPGMGIEMNITNLHLNGASEHYLLVKPGGIDASGSDGLIFSFRLTSERRYRFLNVNRMFVRFEARSGMPATGFSFSVKMIRPPREVNEEVPEPEPVLHEPRETLILSVAGVALPKFHIVKPGIKQLIADMAAEYIRDNNIDPGLNTTFEVTQITKLAVCNIRWPNYETCVEMTFGVPLHYDEELETPRLTAEDLDAMWRTYIVKEPYASRLSDLGITEYAIPDDSTVLMVWLAIALGVVISMGMLGFALWRFRCFEDYTRMTAYADTDSIQNEKKNLDLYPTPHQTLPPLYADTDYKWADDKFDDSARVDLGGFANRSYVRDDLFDFESDEDVITPRDRNDAISPRDIYEV